MLHDFELSDISLLSHLKAFSRNSLGRARQLTLNRVAALQPSAVEPMKVSGQPESGPPEILVNNTRYLGASTSGCGDIVPIATARGAAPDSDEPVARGTEVWEIVNLTGAFYPMRPRFLECQLINRQGFNTDSYNAAYMEAFPTRAFEPGFGPPLDYRAANNRLSGGKEGGNPDVTPYLEGSVQPPLTSEAGWRDTVQIFAGMVTRIVVRPAPAGLRAASTAVPMQNGKLVEELCASRQRLKAHWRRLAGLPEEERPAVARELLAEAGQALMGLHLLGRESHCAAVTTCAAELRRTAKEAQECLRRLGVK